ncbi:hypothetical protein BDR05DRAFT_999808 [Suillus weaverae]|nr:hypothetical protein BDR05DRAFT_999808 [Suillus weaverae]
MRRVYSQSHKPAWANTILQSSYLFPRTEIALRVQLDASSSSLWTLFSTSNSLSNHSFPFFTSTSTYSQQAMHTSFSRLKNNVSRFLPSSGSVLVSNISSSDQSGMRAPTLEPDQEISIILASLFAAERDLLFYPRFSRDMRHCDSFFVAPWFTWSLC